MKLPRLGSGKAADPFASRRAQTRLGRGRRVLLLLVVAAVLGGVAYLVWWSSWLSLKSVEVEGLDELSKREIVTAGQVAFGESLAGQDLSAIERRIERRVIEVDSVQARRCWPDKLCLTVVERIPIAVVSRRDELQALDSNGVLFRSLTVSEAESKAYRRLIRVEVSDTAKDSALVEVAGVVAALPSQVRSKVSLVTAATIDEIGFELKSGAEVVWGSAEQTSNKARVLTALLEAKPDAAQYDVSLPSNPTLRP